MIPLSLSAVHDGECDCWRRKPNWSKNDVDNLVNIISEGDNFRILRAKFSNLITMATKTALGRASHKSMTNLRLSLDNRLSLPRRSLRPRVRLLQYQYPCFTATGPLQVSRMSMSS